MVKKWGIIIGYSNRNFPVRVSYICYPFVSEKDWILETLDNLRKMGARITEVTGNNILHREDDRKFKINLVPLDGKPAIILLNGNKIEGNQQFNHSHNVIKTSMGVDQYQRLKTEKLKQQAEYRRRIKEKNTQDSYEEKTAIYERESNKFEWREGRTDGQPVSVSSTK